MPKVKTITLDGGETAVKFENGYPYYIITNLGDDNIYASGNPDITAYADGVYTILPGTETRISPEKSADTVYLLGSGKVQVRAEEIAVPTSFKVVPKGGGESSGIYSTDEHIIGTWIDGKPIYQKTLHVTLNHENTQEFNHDIADVDIIWINNAATFFLDSAFYASQPFNTGVSTTTPPQLDNNYLCYIQSVNREFFKIRQGNNSAITNAYITLNYTKITD